MNPFEFIYYIGYAAKKHYAMRNRQKLPFPVISIGNLTVGGTGKTPATIALAQEARKRGYYPVILTRGYKGKAKGPCFVSSPLPSHPHTCESVEEAGDEPVFIAAKLKTVPIIKCADRYQGGMFAIHQLKTHGTSFPDSLLFILDDGFQHWQLFRDKNILLVNAENPFGNRRLLPAGLLREPLKTIKRADIIVLSKAVKQAKAFEELMSELRTYNAQALIFLAAHKLLGLRKYTGESISTEQISGKNIFSFCGLADPESFKSTVLSLGCRLEGIKLYKDHYAYKQGDIGDILKEARNRGAEWIVTTEKDIIKIRNLDLPDNLLIIDIEFAIEQTFYNEVFRF